MDDITLWLLLHHNKSTVKLFKWLYLNRALVSCAIAGFGRPIVQVEGCEMITEQGEVSSALRQID